MQMRVSWWATCVSINLHHSFWRRWQIGDGHGGVWRLMLLWFLESGWFMKNVWDLFGKFSISFNDSFYYANWDGKKNSWRNRFKSFQSDCLCQESKFDVSSENSAALFFLKSFPSQIGFYGSFISSAIISLIELNFRQFLVMLGDKTFWVNPSAISSPTIKKFITQVLARGDVWFRKIWRNWWSVNNWV